MHHLKRGWISVALKMELVGQQGLQNKAKALQMYQRKTLPWILRWGRSLGRKCNHNFQ